MLAWHYPSEDLKSPIYRSNHYFINPSKPPDKGHRPWNFTPRLMRF